MIIKKFNIGIIGVGYVGLPLAFSLRKYFSVVCFDTNKDRIYELNRNIDITNEINQKDLLNKKNIKFTAKEQDLINCNFYIVTVPTPIKKKIPDFSYLENACITISNYLKKNDIIVFESTVYPGATEEILIPLIEKKSNLIFNKDFFIGYSPERINPGDKKHTIEKIVKIISGSNKRTLKNIELVYSKIIKAGLHKVSSIQIAEAAKVIENIQRDTNIALINEFSSIFRKMNLNTHEILKASATKWNFLPFKPGMVGGHCIGVDPYYLTYKAKKIGINPKVILSGRSINDDIPNKIIYYIKNLFSKKKMSLNRSKILIMGATFKENVPDIRNSQSLILYKNLKQISKSVDIYDPYIFRKDIKNFELNFQEKLIKKYDCIIITVAHKYFKKIGIKKIKKFTKRKSIIFDVKNMFGSKNSDGQL